MCLIRDECVLFAMLIVQCIGGLPVMALMKLCGISYAVIYAFGFVLSISLTFAPRLRSCCSTFVGHVNEYGICLFLVTHSALLTLSTYTLYEFLVPFFKSNNFLEFCEKNKLADNLTHTGCERLQGLYALSLVALTMVNLASLYLLLLGSRITRKNWSDSARLIKGDAMC
ncbi:hypothetical protein Poli38472_003066 [Pythium oligandrum]|uniref:Uncharacterized protein n=1 Tax=Pythium oligandrum TaxID=41045 RepID=A0A8K1C5V4_PYTOL|nr:hypothetical protein Poli38472_003066 [Pythium oligandrum]|eukprot:TMW57141.1 hypothetical protein Poli38472_003066 [Pythium oligandrum]